MSRADGDSEYSTAAEESVIEPPKPVMAWNLRAGSTVTVKSAGGSGLNATGACAFSFCWPLAVVIQTFTRGDEVPPPALTRACACACAEGTPAPSSVASELATATPKASKCLLSVSLSIVSVLESELDCRSGPDRQ